MLTSFLIPNVPSHFPQTPPHVSNKNRNKTMQKTKSTTPQNPKQSKRVLNSCTIPENTENKTLHTIINHSSTRITMVDFQCFGIMGQPCKKLKCSKSIYPSEEYLKILKVTRRLYTGYNEKTRLL
jgi:preprotein translocase subunit Sss1